MPSLIPLVQQRQGFLHLRANAVEHQPVAFHTPVVGDDPVSAPDRVQAAIPGVGIVLVRHEADGRAGRAVADVGVHNRLGDIVQFVQRRGHVEAQGLEPVFAIPEDAVIVRQVLDARQTVGAAVDLAPGPGAVAVLCPDILPLLAGIHVVGVGDVFQQVGFDHLDENGQRHCFQIVGHVAACHRQVVLGILFIDSGPGPRDGELHAKELFDHARPGVVFEGISPGKLGLRIDAACA